MAEGKIYLPFEGHSVVPPPPYNNGTVSYFPANNIKSATLNSFKNGNASITG